MTTKTASKRRKRCSRCEELCHDVIAGLCSNCESEGDYCTICKEYQFEDGCRHVTHYDGMTHGCGSQEAEADDHKESFMLLLDRFAKHNERDFNGKQIDTIAEMKRHIGDNNFWTFWHGPMIGRAPDLALKHTVGENYWSFADIGSREQESWGYDTIEKMLVGMIWLTSLQAATTKAANKITVEWIEEWEAKKE